MLYNSEVPIPAPSMIVEECITYIHMYVHIWICVTNVRK